MLQVVFRILSFLSSVFLVKPRILFLNEMMMSRTLKDIWLLISPHLDRSKQLIHVHRSRVQTIVGKKFNHRR